MDTALRFVNFSFGNCLIVCLFVYLFVSMSKNETFVTCDEPESSIVNNDLHFKFGVSITRTTSVSEVFSGFEFYLLNLNQIQRCNFCVFGFGVLLY